MDSHSFLTVVAFSASRLSITTQVSDQTRSISPSIPLLRKTSLFVHSLTIKGIKKNG